MAEKMIGHPCNDCGKGIYKLSQKGNVFCSEKCWLGGTSSSVSDENPVERNFDPLNEDLQRRVAELELWRANMKPYLEKVVDEIKSLRILVEEVAGKNATTLHTALPNRDIHEVKTPETAAAIVDSYKSDPTIPTINGVPEGFDK